jgi:hypothetical protein
MWRQQITRASDAQERVVQAGVAFPADAEPAEVVQPGERSFHHPAHAAESRAVVGAAAGDHRFDASAPELATVPVVVMAAIGDHRAITASSWPSARATDVRRRSARDQDRYGHRRKGRRPQPSAVTPGNGRKVRENVDAVHLARSQVIPCKLASFRRDGRTTENGGVPGSSPGLAIAKSL